ncbi:hypothetical protein U1707_17365 [Sphingomonas sp. PB2P12]|uniref:hypothetical protein n=1 Tax=Sphingomonas sandaracina TaxID=3096157 RepID=UPI002FC5BA00
MTNILLTSALLAAAASAGGSIEHQTRIDHPTGAVDAQYRGDVTIIHQQVGTVSPGGRASTLGCVWRANIAVVRDARHASGSLFTRAMERPGAIEGRRAGWCSTHRAAIAREVAGRRDELRGHLIDVAREDHQMLRSDIDRAHGDSRAG